MLPILVQVDELPRHVRDLLGPEEHPVALAATDRLRLDGSTFLSLLVDQPVDMEVLNRTHEHLNDLERHLLLAFLITACNPPEVRDRHLVGLTTLRRDEAQRQEELAHLRTVDVPLRVKH